MATSKTSPTAEEIRATDELGAFGEVVAPDPDFNETPKMADLEGIRYIGFADTRIVSASDLITLGAEDPKGDLVWDESNNFVVPTKEFNASTRDILLNLPDFVVA